jgi:hypothetical protein
MHTVSQQPQPFCKSALKKSMRVAESRVCLPTAHYNADMRFIFRIRGYDFIDNGVMGILRHSSS